MSNPGPKFFGQVKIVADIWLDPEKSDASFDAVADNVAISLRNACDAAVKEIEAPDHGIEVVVR